jgi:long-chain acyl-CoA synthetase
MLTAMLRRAVEANPAKAAIVQGGRRIRYDELEALAGSCAAGLRRLGVGEGNCLAVALPNCPEFVAALFACARLRAIMLPLNSQCTREELLPFMADAHAKVVITDPPRADLFAGTGAIVTEFEALLTEPADPRPSSPFGGPVLYLYTSGSTDARKRLCCTQDNLFYEAHNFVETVGLTATDNILCTIPLHHSYGMGNCLLDAAYAGSTLVLLEPEDTPFPARCRRVLELIREEAIRFYPGVPYQFQVLAALPPHPYPSLPPLPGNNPPLPDGWGRRVAVRGADLAGPKLCVSSGDLLPRQTYDRFLERFGVPIRSLYGSTEAGSIAINTDPDGQMEADSLGLPIKNVAIEIRDAEGEVLPAGVDGEIWVKSPTIPPSGYDNRSDLTHETFRAGFYKTGDIGRWSHRGHLILSGRKQSFINIAGNKVDTSEVEEMLESCPGVREAAVLGVEVPRMGTLLKAAVATEGPCRPAEIREFCRQRLAFYKVPRLIEAYTSLPRNAMGKVLKSELSGVESYLEGIRSAEATRSVRQLSTVALGRRRALMTSLVQAQVAAVLGRPIETVSRDLGFIELGMDSFGAIELVVRLEYLFDQELPQTFTFDHPTIDAITEGLMGLVENAKASGSASARR